MIGVLLSITTSMATLHEGSWHAFLDVNQQSHLDAKMCGFVISVYK